MRNEMTMYMLKPIVSLPRTLHHTKTMYEMQNIHEQRSRDNHTEAENKIVPDITEQSPLPEYIALEIRQEKILTQLAELKQQVTALSNFLKQTNQVTVTSSSHEAQKTINANLIINVCPLRPPYFILALQKVWTDVDIRIQTYTHSSVATSGPVTHHLTTSTSKKKNIINLSVIWKDVEDTELILGLQCYPITGEVNVLRYLSRLLNSHNYENFNCLQKVNTIDLILDLCYGLHFETSSKEKHEILSLIADKIATNWFDNKTPDIADIAVWCTIKQICPNKYPPKLKKWFETCEKLFV